MLFLPLGAWERSRELLIKEEGGDCFLLSLTSVVVLSITGLNRYLLCLFSFGLNVSLVLV